MRAVVYTEYGSPDVLQLTEVATPIPKEDEVLVEVSAASLNKDDLEFLRGTFIVRMASPLKPRYQILGSDVSGRVEAIGSNVTLFQPGDEVFGFGAAAVLWAG
jgi:NADPH:quinone reductase-like Zn-dependent oxidoreductase